MSADPKRRSIDDAVIAWMREPEWNPDETRFNALALEIFAFQFEHCPAYARFCRARGMPSPDRAESWVQIPAVPSGSFKEVRLACFPASKTQKTFRTSGTSSPQRGELHLDTLDLYEVSLEASLRRCVFPDLGSGQRMPLRILAPSAREAPDSSLSHMFHRAIEIFGDASSETDVVAGELQVDAVFAALEGACRTHHAVALCGTAFAFVHLLDALERSARPRFLLPPGSRVMETGGFKGRSREVPRAELHAQIARHLGIEPSHIINQYGMTELASQFYDTSLREADRTRRKLAPPWTRVRVVDPRSGRPCDEGSVGMVVIHDLANAGNLSAIETADLGRRVGDGFEILGREPGAEERGCSIAADLMLGATEPQ